MSRASRSIVRVRNSWEEVIERACSRAIDPSRTAVREVAPSSKTSSSAAITSSPRASHTSPARSSSSPTDGALPWLAVWLARDTGPESPARSSLPFAVSGKDGTSSMRCGTR